MSGAKNTSLTVARPFIEPKRRRGPVAVIGTGRTTGCLPRAMTISSPAHARTMRRERWLLAAWIVMGLVDI